jgi:8-oxo-dGTP pyrophosphatase MutT (NUDIX family)
VTAVGEESTETFCDLRDWLAARLRQPLPPESVRARAAPALSYGRHFGPAAHDARAAAVVVLLYPHDRQWHVPFTVRPETMLAHAGQVSFPGGTVEPGESTRDAALRELREELGVIPDSVDIVGTLSPLYVFASNFMVTPWVATMCEPATFQPCDREVAEMLEVPVRYLLDAASYGVHRFRRGEFQFTAPHLSWGDHRVWGATSIILAELVAILSELPSDFWEVGALTSR